MKKLFIREEHQQSFEEKGYIVLPVSDDAIISKLKELFEQTDSQASGHKLYVSSRDNNLETNQRINESIRSLTEPFIQKYFKDYTLYGGTFVAKRSNSADEFNFHQDYTMVDEREHSTLFAWIPLQDTVPENGAIFLIEKSHRFFTDQFISGSYLNHQVTKNDIPEKYVTTVPLKKGEVLFCSDKVFHGSYPNRSDKIRIATIIRLTDKDAPLIYFHKQDNHTVALYQPNPTDYLVHFRELASGSVPPHWKAIETRPYQHKKVGKSELIDALTGKTNIWQKIRRIFTA